MVQLDQHFMIDETLLKQIAKYAKNQIVTEIGGGTGNLTKYLIPIAQKVYVIEKDPVLCKQLREKYSAATIIEGNALREQFRGIIVANIPYAISEPLFYRLIKEKHPAYITVGIDFAKTILSNTTKIGIYAQIFFTAEKIQEISPEAFSPQPSVNSALIALVPKEYGFIGEIVIQHDKKLKNAIRTALSKYMTQKQARLIEKPLLPALKEKKLINFSNTEFIETYEVLKALQLQHDAFAEINQTTQQL